MNKKNILVGILVIIFVIATLAGAWFYYSKFYRVNYLIPGVPYNGIYNLFFQRADSTSISSVMDILGYWGDERFSVSDLQGRFMPSSPLFPESLPSSPRVTTLVLEKFFKDNGYETYRWTSGEAGGEIKKIKKFVNSQKKIPVIVYQKRSLGDLDNKGFRVAIGIFDNKRKIIVHDHDQGNNYEISYKDFEAMFGPNARAILAVWPSDDLAKKIKGPDYNISYPQRLEGMDKIGNLLVGPGVSSIRAYNSLNFEKSSMFSQQIINDPNFKYFPPAFQIRMISLLAQSYISLNKFDEAIEVTEKRILPLNHNLNEAFAGWVVPSSDKSAFPYFILSQAYLKKGQKDLAIANYKKLMSLVKINEEKTGQESSLWSSIIALENELFSKK